MQARGRGAAKPPIGIAYECDLGNDIDSVLTLAALLGLTAKGEVRNISLTVSKSNLKAAQLADVINTFYSGRGFGGGVPVGLATDGKSTEDTPILTAVLAKKNAAGAPAYTSVIQRQLDTAENPVVIRNMLLAQVDQNAIILVTGPLTGLAKLMDLYGSKPQIAAKTKLLIVTTGAGIKADAAAARRVFAEWPTPIVAVGPEVGAALPFPAANIESDLAFSPAHPVADAYRAFKAMPYDAPSPGLAAVLYSARPEAGLFKLSDPGTITVQADGSTRFAPSADGKHRSLIADPSKKEEITKIYTELVATKPAPPVGRGARRGAVPPTVPPPKPAEVKPPSEAKQ